MTQEHPITPPPELREKWRDEALNSFPDDENPCPCDIDDARDEYIATRAANWGADQELEECDKALRKIWQMDHVSTVDDFLRELRSARRPKQPSLKEQALKTIVEMANCMKAGFIPKRSDLETIRRALESLPD